MLGVYFYLQIIFAVFLVWATSAAFYMGIFHAHKQTAAMFRKAICAMVSVGVASLIWFFLYSWTYLSW